jgi:Mg2+ and Co2+ transporter CorA
MLTDSLEQISHFPPHDGDATESMGPTIAFRDDFARALCCMEECQKQIDKLAPIATSTIAINDSKLARQDAKNVARLTWLATFFIPLSYIASLFSMQSDISTLVGTYKLYFKIAVPIAVVSLSFLWALKRYNGAFWPNLRDRLW